MTGSGMTSPEAHWHVSGIEAKLAEVTAAGDPDGNALGLIQDR